MPDLPLPDAVLWDLDGTLVDTEPAWMDAEVDLVARYGGTWTHADAETLVGSALPFAADVLRSKGVVATDEEIIDHLIGRVLATIGSSMPWQPGVLDLLGALRDAAVPCAIVTMSYRRLAQVVVDAAPPGTFVTLVAGDEVAHGKPHPEPYLRGAELLGVDPRRCVAVEDSPTGLASAEAAGTTVIGVQHVVPVAPAPRRNRLHTLVGFGLDDLRRVFAGELYDQLA